MGKACPKNGRKDTDKTVLKVDEIGRRARDRTISHHEEILSSPATAALGLYSLPYFPIMSTTMN